MEKFTQLVLLCLVLLCASCETIKPNKATKNLLSEGKVKQQMSSSSYPKELRDKIIRLHHEDPVERAWAAYQLGKLGPSARAAVPYLVRMLADDTPVLLSRYLGGGYHSSSDTTPGQEASRALAKIGPAAITPLTFALKDPDADVRRLAAKALGKIGDLRAIEFLIQTLNDPDRGVRAAAAIAIGQYRHPMASQSLMDLMPTASATVRADIVYAMAQINDIIVVPFLIERLPKEEANVRAAIVYALGKLRDVRVVPSLLKSLNDQDEIIRANACYALSTYYSVDVVDSLIVLVQDPAVRVHEAAAEALSILTGKKFGADFEKWDLWWKKQKASMHR